MRLERGRERVIERINKKERGEGRDMIDYIRKKLM